ncbi:response regulator transcription factor [Paenibacillus radicis (ex Xue et al. 2023)]|uniref:Response regulator n=1 Tax=Paenibacillus radicis (ex Xue et al. 2023) TaxID=2972489 RepID=A0ABT1YQ35_9BACL|nr:response regulator [Paenibacillus radicis (ex Xue et al. 2023)]MCR8635284.1 response regulator [Paenibacillus radicis (ex Xue et al. 2023)]
MLQLLIVDDHPDQVESMAQTIPWCNYGIEAVYKAYSAHEALDYIKSRAIDIMITDIRMPEMNGLELIRSVRAISEKIKCVLMSGFSDFEYAKQAIQYKTAGYLMKPVDTQELTTLIEQIHVEFQNEWNVNEVVQNALYTLRENIPFLRAQLLMDLLQGRQLSHSALGKKMKALNLSFAAEDEVCMMVIRLDGDSAANDEENVSLLEYAVTNMAEEVFGEAFTLWHCKDADGQLVFLVRANKPWEQQPHQEPTREAYLKQMELYAEELQKKTRVYLKRKVSVLLMNQWMRLSGPIASMYQAAAAGVRKHLGGDKQFVAVVSGDMEIVQVGALQTLYEPPLLLHLLETGRWELASDRLELIFAELAVKWRESPEYLSEAFFFIAGAFMRISHKNGRPLQNLIGDYGMKLQQNRPFSSLNQLRDWVVHVFELLKGEHQKESLESKMTVVERIQAYIGQHMDGDASLQAIADHVGLHPAYISKVYKVETGCCISDYVMKIKMDKAVELLRNKNEKVYNIASQLGYQTPHYFIKVFKKYYGMTPQEFKLKQ